MFFYINKFVSIKFIPIFVTETNDKKLTIMKAYEIIEQIKVNTLVYKASYYFNVDDVTVRVSNHLPKRYNWDENENKEKAFFIFTEIKISENQIQNYLESEFSDISFNYMVVESEFNQDLMNYYLNNL